MIYIYKRVNRGGLAGAQEAKSARVQVADFSR